MDVDDKEQNVEPANSSTQCLLRVQTKDPADANVTDGAQYVDNILSSIGFGPFQVLVFLMVGFTYLAFSLDALTFTFIGLQVSNLWRLTSLKFSIIPAVTCVTNIIGGMTLSYLSDQYGRVWPYALSAIVVAVFVLASAFAPSFVIFLALRGLASLGLGGLVDIPLPALVEFLPVKNRGSTALLVGFIQAVGSCVAGGLAWWLVPNYTDGWRYFIMASSIPTFLVAVFRLLLYVESPRYLISRNKLENAWKTLSMIARLNRKDINTIVDKTKFYSTLDCSIKSSSDGSIFQVAKLQKFLCIFRAPYTRRTVCFCIAFTILSMTYYGSVLFLPILTKNLGLPPYLTTFGSFAAQIPGTLLIAMMAEWPHFGRRNTLRLFSAGAAVFYFLFAFVQHPVPVSIFIVLLYFFMNPMLFLFFTYISESYPTDIRAMAVAFIASVSMVNGAWLPFVGGYMADLSLQFPWLSPTVWGSALTIQFLVALLLNHETRNKSLQDVTPSS